MPWLSLYIDVKDTTFSQEFLFNSKPGSRLQWTAGANYFYYKDDWSNLKASGLTPTFGFDPDTTHMLPFGDRKSGGEGKSVSVRVCQGGGRNIKKKKKEEIRE